MASASSTRFVALSKRIGSPRLCSASCSGKGGGGTRRRFGGDFREAPTRESRAGDHSLSRRRNVELDETLGSHRNEAPRCSRAFLDRGQLIDGRAPRSCPPSAPSRPHPPSSPQQHLQRNLFLRRNWRKIFQGISKNEADSKTILHPPPGMHPRKVSLAMIFDPPSISTCKEVVSY